MNRIGWFEQVEADVPAGDSWLCAREVARLAGYRFAKRRSDWRLGRWTAKQAVCAHRGWPGTDEVLAGIEIQTAPSGAPLVDELSISLSHRAGKSICALAEFPLTIGCDLEVIEPRSDEFVADYFTPEEQISVLAAPIAVRARLVTLIWSAKESALKALSVGLRADTRSVSVELDPLRVLRRDATFTGWWSQTGSMLRTIVARDPTGAGEFEFVELRAYDDERGQGSVDRVGQDPGATVSLG